MLINSCGKCNKTITVEYPIPDKETVIKKCEKCGSILFIELASNGYLYTFASEEELREFIKEH